MAVINVDEREIAVKCVDCGRFLFTVPRHYYERHAGSYDSLQCNNCKYETALAEINDRDYDDLREY